MARYIDADKLEKLTRMEMRRNEAEIMLQKKVRDADMGFIAGVQNSLNIIKECPTADVVPKSEVAELICKLECLLCHVTGGRLSKHTYDLATMETVATDCINETYNDGYGEGYKDCATEIFAELETKAPWFCENQTAYEHFNEELAELKKKYTEGE